MGNCQHQIIGKTEEGKLFFCLVFKEYLRSCPTKCPDNKPGESLSFDDIYQENFECVFFQHLVKCTEDDERSFVCEITGSYPDCSHCPFFSVPSNTSDEVATKD